MPEVLRPVSPLLKELSGMAEACRWGEALAHDLALYMDRRIPWSEVDKGALLYGPPGTGKTIFAKTLAATCKVPLVATSYADWQRTREGHLGDVQKAIHEAFRLAKKHAPCILFIDELEAVSSREAGGSNQRWYTNIITALNEELQGISSREGVVVVAATNYPDRIDPALVRAGRLDTRIAIPLPTVEDLRGIIRFHLGDDLAGSDLGRLPVALVGSTGADVERLVRIARRAARKQQRPLGLDDLFDALGGQMDEIEPGFLDRIAVHEAGHATVALLLAVSRRVGISLFRRGESSATTFFDPLVEAVTRKVVERRIAVALAGRAAEQALFGDVTAGAGGSDSSDLGTANNLAFSAVARWGLANADQLWWMACAPEQIIVTHPELAAEAYRMLAAAYSEALALIEEHKAQVRALADALLERRALDHGDIVAILGAGPAAQEKETADTDGNNVSREPPAAEARKPRKPRLVAANDPPPPVAANGEAAVKPARRRARQQTSPNGRRKK
ncbi:MAG TPA: AAA family ATPase [Hyphomicrobiaceae bacterium]|nr:AAA family ATPase [Hyphomicrobiaceae bacterium]